MIRILVLLLFFLKFPDPTEIAKINRLKTEAEAAYIDNNYQTAVAKYSMLYDSMNVQEEEIALNLAHSYYALGDSSNAKANYQHLTTSRNKKLKSIAYQQLGVMAKSPATLTQSLAYLKSALKADPSNEEARYNYEVVKKLLKEQEQQQQENQDQQNKEGEEKQEKQQDQQQQEDQQDQKPGEEGEQSEEQEQKSEQQEGEQGEEQEKEQQEKEQQKPEEGEKQDKEGEEQDQMSTRQKLEEMNISEEKAQMILEALKNNEIQYIQQQKRKATQPKDSGKPDW